MSFFPRILFFRTKMSIPLYILKKINRCFSWNGKLNLWFIFRFQLCNFTLFYSKNSQFFERKLKFLCAYWKVNSFPLEQFMLVWNVTLLDRDLLITLRSTINAALYKVEKKGFYCNYWWTIVYEKFWNRCEFKALKKRCFNSVSESLCKREKIAVSTI